MYDGSHTNSFSFLEKSWTMKMEASAPSSCGSFSLLLFLIHTRAYLPSFDFGGCLPQFGGKNISHLEGLMFGCAFPPQPEDRDCLIYPIRTRRD